jgi:hypothetical protein
MFRVLGRRDGADLGGRGSDAMLFRLLGNVTSFPLLLHHHFAKYYAGH